MRPNFSSYNNSKCQRPVDRSSSIPSRITTVPLPSANAPRPVRSPPRPVGLFDARRGDDARCDRRSVPENEAARGGARRSQQHVRGDGVFGRLQGRRGPADHRRARRGRATRQPDAARADDVRLAGAARAGQDRLRQPHRHCQRCAPWLRRSGRSASDAERAGGANCGPARADRRTGGRTGAAAGGGAGRERLCRCARRLVPRAALRRAEPQRRRDRKQG
jgi:hypothetical protein